MVRSVFSSLLLCAALLLTGGSALASAHASPTAAPSSGPIQGTPGKPLQVGPWRVLVEPASSDQEQDSPALAVTVVLRNTSQSTLLLDSAQRFICYRADVWQSLNFLGGEPLPASSVGPGQKTSGQLLYQLPPDVTTFGLVFFWQSSGTSATGIWLLTLPQ
jgi:hypothetical protein